MPNKLLADLLGKTTSLWYPAVKDSINLMRLGMYTSRHLLEGSVVPAMQAVVSMQEQWVGGLEGALRGDQSYGELASDTWARLRSGARFDHLVGTLGRELFGSACWPDETVLAERGAYRLVYLPPKQGEPLGPPLFHASGSIPYGDRIFRLLPEANLYERFTERGLPVYAMELRGDRTECDYGKLDVDQHVDNLEHFIARAFEHAGKKLVLEGYCGHGMQLLPYLAAKPADAAEKLALVALFVAPVDGRACTMISEMPGLMPKAATEVQLAVWERISGYVWADGLRMGLDLALSKNFIKTPLGRFYDGWCQSAFAEVGSIAELSPAQRKVLAGAYWISPANGNRFPIPAAMVRFANAMFTEGVSAGGEMPVSYRGKALSLRDFAEHTSIPMLGFYGGTDPVILDRSAYPLMGLLGDRYRHIVHPNAGHISYILSPELWDREGRTGFAPNPVDAIVEAVGAADAPEN